jgi:outer membrane protein assembly factor BamE (lipoprotein component of BamABCDE complex)
MKNIFFALLLGLTSCASLKGTNQNLSISYKLHEGMTKNEVEAIMGRPVKSDFYKKVEEWHYCATGSGADELLSLFFFEDKLIAKKNYTVTLQDTRGIIGSCEKFIKMGNYREPDNVTEIRIRY